MKNGEIVSLADSTCLRFIDELRGMKSTAEDIERIRKEIKKIHKSELNIIEKKKLIKSLYTELNTIQFKKDYLCLIMDKESDYLRSVKGFKVNGIEYIRLLATNGGVKNQTIIFTSKELFPELRKRIDNGRNLDKEIVPAKFGAYESLVCSSSVVVSDPKGILVVKDCEVEFYEDIVKLDDSNSSEPEMINIKDYKITKNINDGFGLCLPSIAKKWGEDLKLDYTPSGFCTRPYAYSKGMLVTFDFLKFANEIAHNYVVKDAWGKEFDIRNIDVILTTSMLKLWNSYDSFDDYIKNCKDNNYKFCVTKVTPKALENERNLNYQFIQSYRLNDNQIDKLIKPTIDEIHEILGGDYRKAILFLRGMDITEENAELVDLNFVKALQINPDMINDSYIRTSIYRMIKKRISDAKTGVLKVKGNFQTACGDPYALCQHIFGLKVTGLLNKGEFYSKYWTDKDINTVVCFRAPMTCHNNIRKLHLPNRSEMQYWYEYIDTMLIFNSWDTTAEAENGEDFDGDSNLLTDNKILVENHRELPTVICVQHKAEKMKITDESLIKSNINSFGDDIGMYTNGITSQFDVQAQFSEDSKEFKELDYRIMCGQMFQQNAIDKTKGIVSKDRPKHWFDFRANKTEDSDSEEIIELKIFNKLIVAERKPYFMQYIYPQVKYNYRKYIKDADKKCQTEFKLTLEELKNNPNKTDEEKDFLFHFERRTPVGNHNCIVNKICWKFENEFDKYLYNYSQEDSFNYNILKSQNVNEASSEYLKNKKSIEKIYKEYCDAIYKFEQKIKMQRIDEDDVSNERIVMLKIFKQQCVLSCAQEEMLSNIVLDICYSTNKSKQFAWDICGDVFINNLLKENNYTIFYPTRSYDGEIQYCGENFTIKTKTLKSTEVEL